MARSNRREEILQTLARQLELSPGQPVTTASLAHAVGVSEAALYRHFASKKKMFEALIAFAEDTIFSRINQLNEEPRSCGWKCRQICTLVLNFANKNPGIARLLLGDILLGEDHRLRRRTTQFFARLEVEIKQLVRNAGGPAKMNAAREAAALSNLLVAIVSGRIAEFVRSDFAQSPLDFWDEQWSLLTGGTVLASD